MSDGYDAVKTLADTAVLLRCSKDEVVPRVRALAAENARLRVELLTMRAHLGAFKCRLDEAGVPCPAVSEEFAADMARGPR